MVAVDLLVEEKVLASSALADAALPAITESETRADKMGLL
jgi:hypothetical protein